MVEVLAPVSACSSSSRCCCGCFCCSLALSFGEGGCGPFRSAVATSMSPFAALRASLHSRSVKALSVAPRSAFTNSLPPGAGGATDDAGAEQPTPNGRAR